MTQLFDNTLTYDVVWQAGKRLTAYDVVDARVDQLYHLAGQEPSLAGLVAVGYDRFCIFCCLIDACRRCKVLAFFQCFVGGSTEFFQRPDTQIGFGCGRFLHAQFLCFEIVVIEAVEEEVQQIRNNSLCTFGFQKISQIVVCHRHEFYKNLAYDTYLRFLDIPSWKHIKVMYDLTTELFVFPMTDHLCGRYIVCNLLYPFFM